MYTLITVLIILICLLTILVVLIQNSKGGGFTSGFAQTSQIMGARKSADFLEKLTWGLAIALVVFSLVANFMLPKKGENAGSASEVIEKVGGAAAPAPLPSAPTPEKK